MFDEMYLVSTNEVTSFLQEVARMLGWKEVERDWKERRKGVERDWKERRQVEDKWRKRLNVLKSWEFSSTLVVSIPRPLNTSKRQ